ncbi:hypothetical protein MKK63_05050 [Methylobacterium sp. J-088]|uniref:hypothetical protein n=1 Tax=unclassified Methylobacterium TaxID=2615210 RepID=UPI001FB885F6|nr:MULTISPECIES: hypothetical protein [unclassified Methylobacterium]MCJ2062068.1 hypothetical protein [Methylobacterium sp. J-088]
MASGYVVAAILETAGLVGLVLALVRIQAERRAKVAELRSFLRSGQTGSAAGDHGGSHHRAAFGTRVVAVPYAAAPGLTGPTRDTAARSALRRAIARGGQQFHADTAVPISAG